jgi:hypothetical protein
MDKAPLGTKVLTNLSSPAAFPARWIFFQHLAPISFAFPNIDLYGGRLLGLFFSGASLILTMSELFTYREEVKA